MITLIVVALIVALVMFLRGLWNKINIQIVWMVPQFKRKKNRS